MTRGSTAQLPWEIEYRIREEHLISDIRAWSRLAAGKMVKVYNGRAEIENRIGEARNTLRWDKNICTKFEANEARLKTGVLACNLLHLLRKFHINELHTFEEGITDAMEKT